MRCSVMRFIKDEPMLLVQVLSMYSAVSLQAWRGPLTDKGSKTVQPELDLRSGRTGSIRHSGSCVSLSLIQLTVIVSQLIRPRLAGCY